LRHIFLSDCLGKYGEDGLVNCQSCLDEALVVAVAEHVVSMRQEPAFDGFLLKQ
jgi:hypothetical protein